MVTPVYKTIKFRIHSEILVPVRILHVILKGIWNCVSISPKQYRLYRYPCHSHLFLDFVLRLDHHTSAYYSVLLVLD